MIQSRRCPPPQERCSRCSRPEPKNLKVWDRRSTSRCSPACVVDLSGLPSRVKLETGDVEKNAVRSGMHLLLQVDTRYYLQRPTDCGAAWRGKSQIVLAQRRIPASTPAPTKWKGFGCCAVETG